MNTNMNHAEFHKFGHNLLRYLTNAGVMERHDSKYPVPGPQENLTRSPFMSENKRLYGTFGRDRNGVQYFILPMCTVKDKNAGWSHANMPGFIQLFVFDTPESPLDCARFDPKYGYRILVGHNDLYTHDDIWDLVDVLSLGGQMRFPVQDGSITIEKYLKETSSLKAKKPVLKKGTPGLKKTKVPEMTQEEKDADEYRRQYEFFAHRKNEVYPPPPEPEDVRAYTELRGTLRDNVPDRLKRLVFRVSDILPPLGEFHVGDFLKTPPNGFGEHPNGSSSLLVLPLLDVTEPTGKSCWKNLKAFVKFNNRLNGVEFFSDDSVKLRFLTPGDMTDLERVLRGTIVEGKCHGLIRGVNTALTYKLATSL